MANWEIFSERLEDVSPMNLEIIFEGLMHHHLLEDLKVAKRD